MSDELQYVDSFRDDSFPHATGELPDIDQAVKVNGLRVFTNPQAAQSSCGQGVFYCRREGGPYYRWNYEEKLRQWSPARVRSSDLSLRILCTTNWKAIPVALQKSMVDHYEE